MSTGKVHPDRIWSIEGEHEKVLKQTWAIILKLWGYDLDLLLYADLEKAANFVSSKSKNALPKVLSTLVVSECPQPTERTQKAFAAATGKAQVMAGEYDKSAKVALKDVYPALSKFNGALLHQLFWLSLRNDLPDNNLLRFVRARKFKVHEILEMCAKCLEWKTGHYSVDKWTMGGDAALYFSKKYPELIKAFEMKKVYFRGRDKSGGPVCVIRVRHHFDKDCPEQDFERFICLIIEWFRFALQDYQRGTDGANILFDMTGFSLKNADLKAVKFLAKAFEANYPESLNAIWIHKAPWIFNAVWKIIRPWLDPVVASKVHFTKTVSDLEKFVDKKFVPKDLGGADDYVPEYITPTEQNSATLPKDDKYEALMKEREQLAHTFFETTLAWVQAKKTEELTKLLDLKIQLGAELAQNYIKLDPYVRQRGAYDRDGSLGEMGF